MEQPEMSDTEKRILQWADENNDSDTCNDIHVHFDELAEKFDDWPAVAHEGLRLWNIMFKDDVEQFSAIDGVIAGVAGAAYDLAIRQVAKQLGVSRRALMCALEREGDGDSTAFVAECNRQQQRLIGKDH
jgi:hypothetical protein